MLRINCISCNDSDKNYIVEGHSIRLSYLLSDKLTVTGSMTMAVDFEKLYTNPSEQLKKGLILDFCKRQPDPKVLETIENMYETLKRGRRNIKHEPKDVIVARKRCERALDDLYKTTTMEMRNAFARAGYIGLDKLKEEGAIETVGSDVDDREIKNRQPRGYPDAIAAKWRENDELYAIIDPFWTYIQKNNLTVFTPDGQRENAQALLFPLPRFPLLNPLTAGELKAVKQDVFGENGEIRSALSKWSLKLKEERFDSAPASSRLDYYNDHILPLVTAAEEKISRSELLQREFAKRKEFDRIENYLVITDAKTVWEYMVWSGMVSKEGLAYFEENYGESAYAPNAVLLVATNPKQKNDSFEQRDKKSLEL